MQTTDTSTYYGVSSPGGTMHFVDVIELFGHSVGGTALLTSATRTPTKTLCCGTVIDGHTWRSHGMYTTAEARQYLAWNVEDVDYKRVCGHAPR